MTVDVVDVYPSILPETGLQGLENRHHKQDFTDKLIKMTQFILKIDSFEFNMECFLTDIW